MSADNFVEIRKFEDGFRWAEGSDSVDNIPENQREDGGMLPDERFKNGPFESDDECEEDAHNTIGFIEYGVCDVGNDEMPQKYLK